MTSTSERSVASRLTTPRPLVIGAVAAAGLAVVVATLILWARYGTAVFYETIAAGIAACL